MYVYVYVCVCVCVCVCIYIYIWSGGTYTSLFNKIVILLLKLYTGCPRRNGQNFGRVFLRLNYTDITQNTYIQS